MTRYAILLTLSLICASMTPLGARAVTVPGGTALLVRTLDPISSSDKAGKTFAARLDNNLVVKGKLTAPAGSIVYGRVESSGSAGRAPGQAKVVLSLTQIVVNGRLVTISTGNYEGSGPRSGGPTADRTKAIGATFGGLAAGTAIGAAGTAIGAAFGGPAAGAAIGFVTAVIGRTFTGPAVNATIGFIDRGKSAVAPAGTQFEFRLTRPVAL